jgi:hypothetical protein
MVGFTNPQLCPGSSDEVEVELDNSAGVAIGFELDLDDFLT